MEQGSMKRYRMSSRERRKRRQRRLLRALLAWLLCLILVALTAAATVWLVKTFASSKKRSLRAQGIEAFAAGSYTQAAGLFDEALAHSAKGDRAFQRDVLQYRAEAELLLQDYQAALYSCGLLLEAEPDEPSFWYMKSICSAALGDAQAAAAAYREGISHEKEAVRQAGWQEALLAAGGALLSADRAEEALALCESAAEEGRAGSAVYNQIGMCRMVKKDYSGACEAFDRGYEEALKEEAAQKPEKEGQESAQEPFDSRITAVKKELAYNRACAREYLQRYEEALQLFEAYEKEFGQDEQSQHEIAFLRTR